MSTNSEIVLNEIKESLKGLTALQMLRKIRVLDADENIRHIFDELITELNPRTENKTFDKIYFLRSYFQGNVFACPVCGRATVKPRLTCSCRCQSLNEEISKRRKATCINKYGNEFSIASNTVKKKIVETNTVRYNAPSYKQGTVFQSAYSATEGRGSVTDRRISSREITYTAPEQIKSDFKDLLNKLDVAFTEQGNILNCNDIKLKIAFDLFDTDVYSKTKDTNYHLKMTENAEKDGFQMFHIFETDNIEIWKSMIEYKAKKTRKIHARNCEILELDNKTTCEFLIQNHLQGACNASVRYGLFNGSELVAVMSFGKSRFTRNFEWELLRFCVKQGCSITGGASKLFKHFIKVNNPKSLVSYANRRFSQGNLYRCLGAEQETVAKPNYWYTKDGKIWNRITFQKHKLTTLDAYASNKSETQIMQESGFERIYDAGNFVFSWVFHK